MTHENALLKIIIVKKKPHPLCCNCNGRNPSNYKGCEKYPVKPRFKKSYPDAMKNVDNPKKIQDKVIPSKIAQKPPKVAPPAPQQIYKENEINGDFSRFTEILSKIKMELRISSFIKLANYFEKLYQYIVIQSDIAKKHIVFMDGVAKINENCK